MSGDEKIFALTLFVDDIERSKAFYKSAFGKAVAFEDPNSAVFAFGDVMINLLKIEEAPGLIQPAKVGSSDAGSRFQLTIQVDDLDSRVSDLLSKGIEIVNGPMDRPWGIRTALIADPDGHLWEIAQ